jgi:hypothetical protein
MYMHSVPHQIHSHAHIQQHATWHTHNVSLYMHCTPHQIISHNTTPHHITPHHTTPHQSSPCITHTALPPPPYVVVCTLVYILLLDGIPHIILHWMGLFMHFDIHTTTRVYLLYYVGSVHCFFLISRISINQNCDWLRIKEDPTNTLIRSPKKGKNTIAYISYTP